MNNNQMKLVPLSDKFIYEVIQNVAELPDRNSPDDWPEAMLVTGEELRQIMMAVNEDVPAIESLPPVSDGNSEAVAWLHEMRDSSDVCTTACKELAINAMKDSPYAKNIAEHYNIPLYRRPPADLTASLQAENKRLLEALKETNEEIRSGIESNVELEAEHSVFARELTAKNDALISEIEGRK